MKSRDFAKPKKMGTASADIGQIREAVPGSRAAIKRPHRRRHLQNGDQLISSLGTRLDTPLFSVADDPVPPEKPIPPWERISKSG